MILYGALIGIWSAAAVAAQETTTVALSAANVQWGKFSKKVTPVLKVDSGAVVTVEMATHHACDDYDRMIKGDAGLEALFAWTNTQTVASDVPTDSGDGVHILSGPIYVNDAEPGDMITVEIVSLEPRKNADGKVFGSNNAAWWGFQARVNKVDGTTFRARSKTNSGDNTDEVVTIYEITVGTDGKDYAKPVYQYTWPVVIDPQGGRREFIQLPGTCVPHDKHGDTTPSTSVADMGWKKEGSIKYVESSLPVKIPVSYHVGCMGLAPDAVDSVDSTPPMVTGGNLDNRRIGVGTTMHYPVQVAGGLLSMGDAHAALGDSEISGSGIETSVTGKFKISLIKKANFTAGQKVQDFPLGETETDYIVHSFTQVDYLNASASDPLAIFNSPSLDPAMKNAFVQTRKWMMAHYNLTEYESTTIITEAVDFAITQVVNGNWGIHAVIPKAVFDISGGTADGTVESQGTRRRLERLQGKADLPLNATNVHWGYFSKDLPPVLTINSGAEIVVEMATHHSCDDYDKMIKGDPGLEDIFLWTPTQKTESKRGATGTGDGVHIMTGPIYVNTAEPGDILKVEILELEPRQNADGKTYGSNAAAWWGFQERVPKADGSKFTAGTFTSTPDENDEFVTIWEIVSVNGVQYATPQYQFEWPFITDPDGVTRNYIAYPGTCVPHDPHGDTVPSDSVAKMGWTKKENITYYDNLFPARVPVNLHIGNIGLAPNAKNFVDSIPPMPSGGNVDDRRIGAGTTMYFPVEVPGGLLSMGDAHTAQGDSELDGTGIETSITGKFKITVIKPSEFKGGLKGLDFPLAETADSWVVHGFTKTNYLDTFNSDPTQIYAASNLDETMNNGYTQTRKFLMAEYGLSESESWTMMTQVVDFGVTQVVDGNWGIHAVIPKAVFAGVTRTATSASFWMSPSFLLAGLTALSTLILVV